MKSGTILHLIWAASALAWSPTNGYAPGSVSCPQSNYQYVRSGQTLNPDEVEWINKRQEKTNPALKEFLQRANLEDFDINNFFDSATSNVTIGLAFSGGGYRAMLSGAGQFAALDSRHSGTTSLGGVGGIVQASTYITALSGGGWFLGSIFLNNFTTVDSLASSSSLWQLKHSLINPGGLNIPTTIAEYATIAAEVISKQSAGFNVSITDIYGRLLSYQMVGLDNGGPSLDWSDLRNFDFYTSQDAPFPIIVSTGRAPGTIIMYTNSTSFETTPLELGSFDPAVRAFADLQYIGTNLNNGAVQSKCVRGFDNAGFVMGTSSNVFNGLMSDLAKSSDFIPTVLKDILNPLDADDLDLAKYQPNPFYNYQPSGFQLQSQAIIQSETLSLTDGGISGLNVPLQPLLQPSRNVDVILSFDNSADSSSNWPDGESLANTYSRQFHVQSDPSSPALFPYFPDNHTVINEGLYSKPTFFGCYASNLTTLSTQSSGNKVPPLVVAFANYPYSFMSNTSTFKLSYTDDEKSSMIQNGIDIVSQFQSDLDPEWPACLSCALIQRETERQGLHTTDQCQKCFSRYCWNGSLSTSSNITPTYNNPQVLRPH